VLSNRERLVAIQVRDKGFLVMTLRTADEVRHHQAYFEDIDGPEPDQEMLELASALIDKKSGAFDPSEFRDAYHDALLELVKAKIKGQEPVIARAPERGKVINLMDALRRSLDDTGKPPAESKPRKSADAKAKAEGAKGKAKGKKGGEAGKKPTRKAS
jgi:DNA end-binding protein Ku